MKITLSGEYHKILYWLYKLNWFFFFYMILLVMKAAWINDPFLGTLSYIAGGCNACFLLSTRVEFLENEMFRIAEKILKLEGMYRG